MKHLILLMSLLSLMLFLACDSNVTGAASGISEEINQKDKNNKMEKQSKETMDIANKFMEAMGKGDMETMVSLMDEDMVWQNEGDKSMPWIGPWKGKKVILETFLPLFMEHFKTTKWLTEDAISSGDVAAFFGQMKGITLKSNQETPEFAFALRVKVANGKIVLWNWLEDSYAVSNSFHGTK